MSNCYSTYSKGFFFSLVKALACLGLLNILSSCKFLAGICVRNHAKQSLQMLTSSSVWLSQCRVCALFFFHLPSQKTPTLLFVHCCSKHMNYGSSARKDFSNQSQKECLIRVQQLGVTALLNLSGLLLSRKGGFRGACGKPNPFPLLLCHSCFSSVLSKLDYVLAW